MTVTLAAIQAAHTIITPVIQKTPVSRSHSISAQLGKEVWIKWENSHPTGSFKERGAAHFLAKHAKEHPGTPVFAASAGNHALAVSRHAERLGLPCTIVMPKYAPLVKVQRTRAQGATVVLQGTTFDEARAYAQAAYSASATCVPAFDHEDIIAGQGTCGLEVLEQVPDIDALIVPVGGGGLISGIATAAKAIKPEIQIIGVQSEWAVEGRKDLHRTDLLTPLSLADGIAVKRIGQITSGIIDALVDSLVTVSEIEIAKSIIQLLKNEHVVVEGAGAAGFAALLNGHVPDSLNKIMVIQCGSNIDMNVLGRLIEWDMAQSARILKLQVSVPDRPGSLQRVTEIIAAAHANVLRVLHDRSFADQPGCVQIGFVLEIEDQNHQEVVMKALQAAALTPRLF